jgi:hypothetical protein
MQAAHQRTLAASTSGSHAAPPVRRAGQRSAVRCSATGLKFRKYQGLGNDFILVRRRLRRAVLPLRPLAAIDCQPEPMLPWPALTRRPPSPPVAPPISAPTPAGPQVDNRHQADPIITPEQAAKICDRNFGIGGDGVSAPRAGSMMDWAGSRMDWGGS